MQRTYRSLMALLLSAMFAGCASQGPSLESPEVLLQGVELQKLSFSGQSVLLHFDVNNPNRVPLPVKSVRYKVFLENQQFASGETAGRFTIPARGNGEFSITVELDLMKSAASLLPLLNAGSRRPLEYALHGSLAVAIPFTRPLGFTRQGTIVMR